MKNKSQTAVINSVSCRIFIIWRFVRFSPYIFNLRSLLKIYVEWHTKGQVYKNTKKKLTIFITTVCVLFFIKLKQAVSNVFSSHAFSLVIFVYSMHDDLILLLRPESSRVLLSCANDNFCHLNLPGISKLRYERKNEKRCGRSSRIGRCRANGPLNNHLLAAFIILPLTLLLKPPAYSLVTYARLLAMTSSLNFWIWSRRIPWR